MAWDARTGEASFARTFAAIAGISEHAGRYGAGSVIPFQLGIRFPYELQLMRMGLQMLCREMRTGSREGVMGTTC